MSNPIYHYELQIKEQHLDTFGHVNNAVYLMLYEEARWDFITKNQMGLNDIMEKQRGPVVLDLQLTFKRELKNREMIRIESQARTEMKNKYVLLLDQRMYKSCGTLASTLTLSVGMMDLKERKLILPDENILKALGVFECQSLV